MVKLFAFDACYWEAAGKRYIKLNWKSMYIQHVCLKCLYICICYRKYRKILSIWSFRCIMHYTFFISNTTSFICVLKIPSNSKKVKAIYVPIIYFPGFSIFMVWKKHNTHYKISGYRSKTKCDISILFGKPNQEISFE